MLTIALIALAWLVVATVVGVVVGKSIALGNREPEPVEKVVLR